MLKKCMRLSKLLRTTDFLRIKYFEETFRQIRYRLKEHHPYFRKVIFQSTSEHPFPESVISIEFKVTSGFYLKICHSLNSIFLLIIFLTNLRPFTVLPLVPYSTATY